MHSASPHRGKGRLWLLACLALLVAACSKVPLGSLWQLRQFDFETFDPGVLRVAMHLPGAYGLAKDAVWVDVKVKREADTTEFSMRFVLRETRDKAEALGLPPVDATGGRWVVLRFEPDEAERVREFRARLVAMKKDPAKKEGGSLSLGTSPRLCRTGATMLGTPRVSAAMLWQRDKGYVPILREGDLDELIKSVDDSASLGELPRC